ncbi:hypothetical protein FAM09_12500 [Niastella caeni]|uniref:Uncharacterized protein n=1 Tax=Niastella caeni TaxID=2569763 RepID=A0A4S8HUP1_9BACT|nr:hypothetical protein [Niastella caeni]THU39327.1 hypothetical protein FAM09_12500 [Niastella caeni]
MADLFERKKIPVLTEFFALAIITAIGVIRYFNLHNTVKIGWLLAIALGIIIAVYQLAFFLFFKSKLFKAAFIVFAAALWGVLAFHIVRIVRDTQDNLTWLAGILIFFGMLLTYIHFHFKRIF